MKSILTLTKSLPLICMLGLAGLLQAQINTPSGAVVPFGANKTYAYGILPTNLPSGGTYGQAQDAANAYNTWKNFYVEDCGGTPKRYRVKFDDPNKTVSEGIAYGMLLAAYAADKPLFDGLWNFFNAYNTNGLMSWRVDGCGGANKQNGSASDSDFDAAFALIVAKNQWPTGTTYNGNTYSTEANAIIAKIRKTDGSGDMATDGQALNGNTWGTGDFRRNPSYQSPAYYREYATQVSDGFWSGTAVNGAYNLLNANLAASGAGTGLVSDWAYNNGSLTTFNGGTGYTPTLGYGYDACRNPMRMAQDVIWNDNASAKSIMASMAAYLNGRGVNNVGGPLNPNGTNYAGYSQNATFYATYAMGLVGTNGTYQSLLNQFYTKVVNTTDQFQNQSLSGYFGNTLRVMSLFMMSGNMWKIGTTSLQDINIKVSGVDVPSNTVFDFQNVQTATGKTITFMVENKGFANLNLTGIPKVAITGSANYTVNQASIVSPLGLTATTIFTVTLTPSSVGTKTAVIIIANNDPDATETNYTISLTGIGTQFATSPNILVKQGSTTFSNGSNFSVGNATQAATSTQTFQVINTGDAPLNISSVSITGATFALSGIAPTVVAIGGTANFSVAFTPIAATTYNGTARITSNDASDPLFIINLSGVGVACPSSTVTNVIQDWDANSNLVATWNSSVGYAITATTNPSIGGLNTSPTALLKRRNPAIAANNYGDGFRFNLCGSTVNALNMVGKATISMLVYSSKANTPISMALDNNASLGPPYANLASNTQFTTKVNQWERLYFDLKAATGSTDVRYITFQINPTAVDAGTYYFDDIKYDAPLCPSLTSSITSTGVFQDFDALKNMDLQYVYGNQVTTSGVSLDQFASNPSVGTTNTSTGVAQYIRGIDGRFSTSGFNFLVCNGVPFPNSQSKVLSMLVYSPAVGTRIQINAYNGASSYSAIAQTTMANQWERLYFNYTNYTALTAVTQFEFFFDASDAAPVAIASPANRTYYFDQIKFDSNPCVTGIPSTQVFNDYDFNRYVNLAFLPVGTINEAAANPSATGINTTAGVAQYARPSAATQYDIIRYGACQGVFDVSTGKTTINLMIYSANPTVEVTMSLKLANGTTAGSNVTVTATGAGAWKQLSFDNITAQGRTDIAYIDILIDPLGKNGASTYYIDNLRYAPPAPRIALVQGTTNLPTTSSFSMGLLTSCGIGSNVDFQINNLGLADLNLSGTPVVSIGGANASDFSVTYSPQFANPVSALSGTQFTLKYTPTAAGARSAIVSINSNDLVRNPFLLYVNGTSNFVIGNTGIINGISTVCSNFIGQYYTASVAGATAYNWTVPSGATLVAGQGTSVVTVNWGLSSGGNLAVTPYSSCITGTSSNLNIKVNAVPTGSGSVVGLTSPCTGTTATYSVSGLANVTNYVWSVPGGSTIASGNNTNIISVTLGSTNGNISVSPSNSCGTVTGITPKAITINPAPAPAGAISGVSSICSGLTSTYSISPVTNASGYIWSLGTVGSISTGQGTVSISVAFVGSGNTFVQVSPQFACGSGAASSLNINVKPTVMPSILISAGNLQLCSGQSSTVTVSGSNLGSITTGQYVTNNVPGAVTSLSTYTFTPSNGNTISVIATTTGGCFTNPVMSSSTLTYNVSSSQTPAIQIGVTSGSSNSCAADFIKFTATSSAAGTTPTYQWKNGTTNVGSGGNTFGGTNFANGSIISVVLTSSLSCATQATANSNTITLNTTLTGVAPCVGPVISTISGATNVSQNLAAVVYTVPLISGALYNWTVPGGAIITSGQNTNSITVTFGPTTGALTLAVAVSNNYGTTVKTLSVNSIVTEVDDQSASNEISLFPNPSNGSFNIKMGQSIANQVSVEIVDSKGALVYKGNNIIGANLGNDLTVGHYIVSVITADKVKRLQFLKME